MPSTTTFKRGQVIVVKVPFSDRSGVKPRPALVVSAAGFHRNLPDVIACPVAASPGIIAVPVREIAPFGSGAPSDSDTPAQSGFQSC